MRRHRVFLLCTVGLCVISFLHYYKALHYVSLLRELSAPYPNIKSFIMVTGFFWKEKATPLSSASPEEAPPPVLRPSETRHRTQEGTGGMREGVELNMAEEPRAPQPWARPVEPQHTNEVKKTVFVLYSMVLSKRINRCQIYCMDTWLLH